MAFQNPCTGELFVGVGFMHTKVTLTLAPNFHVSAEENLEGVKGTTASGVRYVVPEQTSSHMIIDQDFAPANATVEHMMQFIRQAEDGTFILGDDFFVRIRFHVTINANGDETVSFFDPTATCH
jgi:hypothetical protein